MPQVETTLTVDALVAEFALLDVVEITAIPDERVDLSIVGILRLLSIEDEITILQTVAVVGIVAVNVVIERENGNLGDSVPKIAKLIEEWP
jgi:hypothetical protein